MTSDPDNLYLNIRINRGGDSDPRYYTNVATYDIVQNNPIINNPSEYYLAITDYSIPLESIPLNIARVVPNQPNPNLMTSTLSLVVPSAIPGQPDNVFTLNVEFIPTTTVNPPIQNQQFQVITSYYFIYTPLVLLNSFNQTLDALLSAASISLPVGIRNAYFALEDGDFQKLVLVVPDYFVQNNIRIAFNTEANNYFGGFSTFFNINSLTNRYTFLYYNTNNLCDELGKYDVNGSYWKYIQQSYLLPQWSSLSKILIYTTSIPIRNQQSSSNNRLAPDLLSTLPLLFVDIPDYNTISQAGTYAYFIPGAQYQLVDLISETPLRKIQINIAWMDHNGEVFPLYLQPYNSCNLQIGFFKKSLYNQNVNKQGGRYLNYN